MCACCRSRKHTEPLRQLRAARGVLLGILDTEITGHLDSLDSTQPRDFIDRLCVARDVEAARQNDKRPGQAPLLATEIFSNTKIALVCMDLFLAGTDTSSTTVEWLLALLAVHTDVQRQLQVCCSDNTAISALAVG